MLSTIGTYLELDCQLTVGSLAVLLGWFVGDTIVFCLNNDKLEYILSTLTLFNNAVSVVFTYEIITAFCPFASIPLCISPSGFFFFFLPEPRMFYFPSLSSTLHRFCSVISYNSIEVWKTVKANGNPLQYSCLENPTDGGAWKATVHGVAEGRTRLSDFTFTFHFLALEKEMATHSSVLAWRIPGTGEPDGLPSVGLHRVGHDWSDLAAVAVYPTTLQKSERQ